MSILQYFNQEEDSVVRTTLSELRPKLTYIQTIENLVDHLYETDYNDSLELTITLTERTLDTFTPKYISKAIRECIRKHDNRFLITLLADYSETGRLHFHGVIKSKDGNPKGLDYIKRKLTHRFGRTELKPIRERLQWLSYIVKHYYKHSQMITSNDIITNDTSIFKVFTVRQIDKDFALSLHKRIIKHLNAP